jgi:glutathione synthase/RimK-type ligase-like ATP-grasp enzyme
MIDLLKAAEPFAPLIGVAPLLRRALMKDDLRPLGAVLLARAQANPLDANAYLDFSTVLQLTGERDYALAVQAEAIRIQPFYSLPAKQSVTRLRLLVVMGPGDLMSNTPIECLLEESDVALDLLFLTPDSIWPDSVPQHDVMMVAIAESDTNQSLLHQVAHAVADWPRPVINAPELIAVLSRDGVCAALTGIDGVLLPLTARTDRGNLLALAADASHLSNLLPDDQFPLIVRPLGSHAGQNLEKLSTPAHLADYLERVDGERFYLSRFVDYRSADGMFRKYRIALIEGIPYICHFAVSEHWMIHYLNAGMDESAEKRRQEAECMASFDEEFAVRHRAALTAVFERLGLPYLGIDCAETQDGQLLIFEIDNAMIVHAMDSEELYGYKRPAMQRVFAAFRALLQKHRAAGTPISA